MDYDQGLAQAATRHTTAPQRSAHQAGNIPGATYGYGKNYLPGLREPLPAVFNWLYLPDRVYQHSAGQFLWSYVYRRRAAGFRFAARFAR